MIINQLKYFPLQLFVPGIMLFAAYAQSACSAEIRYRGQYTYGHEVNAFCPAINSQCYWLSPETLRKERQMLKELVSEHTRKAYESVCVILTGQIDKTDRHKHSGFAVDYDGLFTVYRVFDLCSQSDIVTQGDIQHHRWTLDSINGTKLETEHFATRTLDLDFGSLMGSLIFVSGGSGCNQFSGQAVLYEKNIRIESLESTDKLCSSRQNRIESLILPLLKFGANITIDDNKHLLLESNGNFLKYRLNDWRL